MDKFDLKLFMLPIINNKDVKESKFDVAITQLAPIGRFDLGFAYYFDQNKENKHKLIKDLGDRKIYRVLNPFELYLTNNEKREEMQNRIRDFIGNKEDVTNNITMQMWEMIMLFNITANNNTFNIISKTEDDIKFAVNNFSKKITSNKMSYVSTNADVAIVTNEMAADIVLYRESVNFTNILTNMIKALDNLKNGGKMILQIDETFTTPTCKLIQLCKSIFDNAYIYKPYFSRLDEAEKYLICVNFNSADYKQIKDKLHKSAKIMKDNKGFVIDFMEDININDSLAKAMQFINVNISGWQHRATSEIIKYVKGDNYSGQEYNEALDDQLKAVEFFATKFFPINSKDYVAIQKELMGELKKNINMMKKE